MHSVGPRLWSRVKFINYRTVRWMAINLKKYINGPQRMNPSDFGNSLTFLSSATMRFTFMVCGEMSQY